MVKAHSPINWENEPSFNTPINEENLNKMDSTIGVLDDRIIEQETSKLDKSTAYTMVKDISFNENNGVFTVTRLNGSTFTIDTKLEKISINFSYNAETQQIEIILIDGTKQYIDISSLISPIDFVDSDTIGWEVTSDWKVKAKVLDGSITEDMLQPNYLAEIKLETEKSAQSMANAKISENNAKQSELNAKASEEQALEYSNNAQPLAQSVSGNNPTATNSANGKPTYLNNKGYTQQDSTPSPDNPIRIGGLADKGYFDGVLLQGSRSSANGSFSNSSLHLTSANGIECKENDIVKVSYEEKAVMSIIFYDENMNHISGSYIDNENYEYEQTAPKNAKYVYFNIYTGATLTPSTAKHICVTLNGQYALRVKTENKNLAIRPMVTKTGINSKGEITDWTGYIGTRNYIPVKENTRYVYSSSLNKNLHSIVFYDKDHNIILLKYGYFYSVFTTPENTKYIRYSIENANLPTWEQLEQGEVATPYEPHQETTALIPVSAPFYEGDYIEVYADGSGQIMRENKEYEIAQWQDVTNKLTNTKELRSPIITDRKTAPFKCEIASYVNTTWNVDTPYICSWGNAEGSQICLRIPLDAAAGDHLCKFVYKLATPTSTPLTAEQVAEFLKLRTYKGVTHVNADGEIVMRYYCDNDSGETVSMLQGMVEETKEAVSKVENLGNAFEVFDVTSASISLSSGQTNTIMLPLSADGYSALGVVGASSDTDGVDIGGVTMDIDRVTAYVKVTNHTSASKSAKVTIQVLYIK